MILVQKAVIQKNGKFLTLFRSPNAASFPEHWDFPGGKLEPGEEPFAGIEREVLEETRLTVKALAIVGTYEMTFKNIPHRFTLYSTKLLSKKVTISHEHTAFKWATKEEILKLDIEPYIPLYFKETN